MSTVRLLSPNISLIETVVEILDCRGKDLSNSVVVFPGKRPSHVLRKKLSEKIGSAFIPPKIFSIDIFIDHLCTTHLALNSKTIDEFDAVAVLYELHSAMQRKDMIGGEHFSSLETFYPVGIKIFSELEELMIADVSAKQLSGALASVTIASAHTLSLLYEPFYAALKKRGYTSRALKYRLVAEQISSVDFSGYHAIILAGFYALTSTETIIIRHLLSLSNVTMLFQQGEGIRTTLEQLNIHPVLEGTEVEPQQYFYQSPDAHGQLFVLNRMVSEQFPEPIIGSEEAAIVLPSAENLFPLYHQTLSAYDQNTYNIALGYPVSRTPVYGFLISLLEVVTSSKEGEVFVPSYIQFLLHPYTKNILYKTRTDVTRIAVHAIEDDCLEHSARVFMKLEAVENNQQLHDTILQRLQRDDVEITSSELREHLIRIHDATLRSLLTVTSVKEFASACINVLQFINEHSTAHRHPYFRPFVETLLEQFVSLQQSLLSLYSFRKLEHYLLFLRHFIRSAEVPFTGTPLQGLQVLGFLETRGLKFNHVFIIDVNDDVLPGKAQQDVLLPLTLREQLGLSTYRDQERMKAYLFDVLRRSCSSVHYFYVNNHEKEQSRFIAQLQWEEQRQRKELKQFNTRLLEYTVDLGTETPQSITKTSAQSVALKNMHFSSTMLDTYLTCGLKFYYHYILQLSVRGEISGDVEKSDIGKVVHQILAEYFAQTKDRALEISDLNIERLQSVIQKNFRTHYGSTQFGEQFFTKRQVEKHLIEFVEQFQRPLVQSSTIIITELEQKFSAEIEGFHFTGNADRIETRNGITYILDYKTGQNESDYGIRFGDLDFEKRDTWKKAIGSLQLVMYVMLYSAISNILPEKTIPAFIFLGKKELDKTIEKSLFDSEEQMKEWYPKLKEIVLLLTKEIHDESIPFSPTRDIKNDCPECPFSVICGTQWTTKYNAY